MKLAPVAALFGLALLAQPATAFQADDHLKLCIQAAEKAACEAAAGDFRRAYGKAIQGDYQGQRNVAYMLGRGYADTVLKDRVTSCAWRLVVVASGSPKVDDTDLGNVRVDCGRLDAADRAKAETTARVLAAQISTTKSARR
jgi:hypothetical protein